uniref:Ig-like domain-containing protein n=1 Tax=Esox lucius TaxID=8010 RepID=A0A3P8ZVU0_ESOLU
MMLRSHYCLPVMTVLHSFPECRGEDSVTQPTGDVITTEGGQIKLGCTFNTLDTNPYLFWYKQGANDHPKYMLRRFKVGTGDNAPELKDRFHADVDANANSVPLRIKDLQLSDSAVYYCALRPTVTTGCTTPLQKRTIGLHNDETPDYIIQSLSVKMKNVCNLIRTDPIFPKHSPQDAARDTVKCLLQIHKTHVDWLGKLP